MNLPTIQTLDLRSEQVRAAEAAAREARIIRWTWPTTPSVEQHSVKAPPTEAPDPNLLRIERAIVAYSGMLPVYLPPARKERAQ